MAKEVKFVVDAEDKDLLCAAAKFLRQHLKGSKGIELLVQELEDAELFPKVTTWTGNQRRGTIKDIESRFGADAFAEALLAKHLEAKKLLQADKTKNAEGWQKIIVDNRIKLGELQHEVAFGKLGGDRREAHLKQQVIDLGAQLKKLLYQGRKHSDVHFKRKLVLKPSARLKSSWNDLKFLKKIQGHHAFVYCIVRDKTGRWIVTGADDNLVKLWNSRTGALHTTYWGHSEPVADLAIDSSNKLLASAANDKTIRLWELMTGRALCVFTGHKAFIECIEFDAKRAMLLSGSNDGSCCVWECESVYQSVLRGELVQQKKPLVLPHVRLDGPTKKPVWVNSIAPHPSGDYVATASEDGVARVWYIGNDLPEETRFREAMRPTINLIDGEITDGYNRLVTSLQAQQSQLSKVMWSNSGDKLLCVSSKDGSVAFWSWDQKELAVNLLETIPRKKFTLLSSISNATVPQPPPGQRGRRRKVKAQEMNAVALSCDDRWIITAQSNPTATGENNTNNYFFNQQVRVWNSDDGSLVHVMRAHRSQAHSVLAHPTEPEICVTSGSDGLVIVWDIKKGVLLSKCLALHKDGISSILDSVLLPFAKSACDIACTDSLGRLCLLGRGDGHEYAAAPTEQFLENDRGELTRDAHNNVIDSSTQLARHLMPRAKLCNASFVVYEHQPPTPLKGEGSFHNFAENKVENNYKQRVSFVRVQEMVAAKQEREALERAEHILKAQDQDIADAIAGKPRAARDGSGGGGGRPPQTAEQLSRLEAEFRTAFSSDEEAEQVNAEEVTEQARPARRAARRAQGRMRRVQNFLGETTAAANDANTGDGEYNAEADVAEIDEEPVVTASPARRGRPRGSRSPAVRRSPAARRGRPAQTRRGFSAEMNAWINVATKFDRSWLQNTAATPQIGDQVVYIVHAHNDVLHKDSDPRPWIVSQGWKQSWLALLCKVTAIEYKYPFEMGDVAQYGTKNEAVYCNLKLEALKAPMRERGTQFYMPTSRWADVSKLGFEFDLKYERSHGMANHLINQSVFDIFSQADFKQGTRVLGPRDSNGRSAVGVVLSVDSRQLHASVKVKWEDQSITQNSFWNLYIEGSGRPFPYQLKPPSKPNVTVTTCNKIASMLESIASTQPCAAAFAAPVDCIMFKDYLAKVPLPIDLKTISTRLRQTYYRSYRELYSDLYRMRSNCYLYNPAGSPICAAADEVFRLSSQSTSVLPANARRGITEYLQRLQASQSVASSPAAAPPTKPKAPKRQRAQQTANGNSKRKKRGRPASASTAKTQEQQPAVESTPAPIQGMEFPEFGAYGQLGSEQIRRPQVYFNDVQNQHLMFDATMGMRDPTANSFVPMMRPAERGGEGEIPGPMSYMNYPQQQAPPAGVDRSLGDQRNLNLLYKQQQQRYNNGAVGSSSSTPYPLDPSLVPEFF